MRRTLTVQEDPQSGDLFIELPEDVLQAAELSEGDIIQWIKGDGDSWILRKKDDAPAVE